jgi:hypothetical protein
VTRNLFLRSVFVAAAFAAVGVLGEVAGCIALLGVGIIALAVLRHAPASNDTRSASPRLGPFVTWGICIFLFAVFVLLLSPLASLPATVLALLLLSPLFGTLVLLVSSALERYWRFSLRTLLIATTLVAVGLGLVVALR